ncbi:MAG TPA: hypothetical protein VG815_14590 [Chloroflexota bacterium]|nr:hypothetical protein [Chloroflexota bacterium]
MRHRLVVVVTAVLMFGAGRTYAQETPGPGVVEVTIIPAGVGFVTAKGNGPNFGNYGFGTAVVYNINSIIGVEGELAAMLSTNSHLQFGTLADQIKVPTFLNYNVDAIVTAVKAGPAVIYGAGGVGGLTTFERAGLVNSDTNFFVGNVGGGIKVVCAEFSLGAPR